MNIYEKPVIEIENLFSDTSIAESNALEDYFETGVSLNDYNNIWNDILGPLD